MTSPRMNAYLAQAIQASQPSDNSVRIGTVVSLEGTTLKVEINSGTVETGWLSTFTPQVGQTVAVLRESAGWLTIGPILGAATESEEAESAAGGGVIGAAYWTGGTVAATGATEAAIAGWTGSDTFTFEPGQLYRWDFNYGLFDSAGTTHLIDFRLRKGFGTGGANPVLATWRRNTIVGMGAQVQMASVHGFVKNATGAAIATAVGATIQRIFTVGAAGNVAYYGDATYRMDLVFSHVGAITSNPTLAAFANAVT